MVNRANLTGITRRERRQVIVIDRTAAATPEGTVTGGTDDDDATPVIAREVSTGSGSSQALTATPAAIFPAGGAPVIELGEAGVYLVSAWAQIDAVAATTTTQTFAFDVRRQNNTPAAVGGDVGGAIGPLTLVTRTIGMFAFPPFLYTTTNDDDELVIFGGLSALPSAGSLDVTSASLVALRLS